MADEFQQCMETARNLEAANRLDEALKSYLELACHGAAEPWFGAARVLERQGRLLEAVGACQEFLARKPEQSRGRLKLAGLLYRLGRMEEARAQFEKLLSIQPEEIDGLNGLGTTLLALNQLEQAKLCFLKARTLAPDSSLIWSNLGTVQSRLGHSDAGQECYRKSLALEENPTVRIKLANNLLNAGAWEEAETQFRLVLPKTEAVIGLASLLERRGHAEAAQELLEPHLEKAAEQPNLAVAYALSCKRTPDKAIPVLKRALSARKIPAERSFLLHSLSQCLEQAGRYSESFSSLEAAHQALNLRYEPENTTLLIDAIVRVFGPNFWKRWQELGLNVPTPPSLVLIVGMPRSGTSLTEQILACHPMVVAGGEREDLRKAAARLQKESGRPFPGVFRPNPEFLSWLHRCIQQEQARIQLPESCTLSTDKLPGNTLYLGLAALFFPTARVIWCQRDPLDTGLSCYQQNFSAGFPWSRNLTHIAHWYHQQQRLFAHWSQVLPLPIYPLSYEKLVSEPEREIPALLEFCGLPWNEACLSPEKNQRYVTTASYEQVRHPISPASVGRWRRYQSFLEPLQTALQSYGYF